MKPGGTTCPSCSKFDYKSPSDKARETKITGVVLKKGGRLDYRENPPDWEIGSICLTYEFDEHDSAKAAASQIRQQGEHVEGPVEYGD